ncbi:sulfotransferase domain-containing protein [bacterium]|nr:sulfotransferase domain-containing protein [bacterium]
MIVLHIGYAKCATTFLQKNVFPNLCDSNYLGRYYGDEYPSSMKAEWVYDFVFLDKISILKYSEIINRSVLNHSKLNIISHEVLLRPYKQHRLLQRIKYLENYIGKIKILLSIRNQADVILSRYVHDKNISFFKNQSIYNSLDFEGTTECQWPFCATKGRTWWKNKKCFCRQLGIKFINVPFYNYLNLICQLHFLFGKENIHVIVSENLRSEINYEIDRLTGFLGIEAMDSLLIQRLIGKRVNAQKNLLLYDAAKEDFISSGKKIEVVEYFSESNKLLSDLLKIDLEKHDYY